ncbi:hypothetical protein CLK_3470 [Clostridium botulinum A3 str. Loch Maree]|nr:hypothetical protein CLK_3470 [Clostridium botulinum A3 str. Loch Maree]
MHGLFKNIIIYTNKGEYMPRRRSTIRDEIGYCIKKYLL